MGKVEKEIKNPMRLRHRFNDMKKTRPMVQIKDKEGCSTDRTDASVALTLTSVSQT